MRPRRDAIKWRRICCVPSDSLYSLQSEVMALKVLMYSADWDSLDGDVDNSCLSAIKKISTVKPRPAEKQISSKRHSCSCTRFSLQRADFSLRKDLRSLSNS